MKIWIRNGILLTPFEEICGGGVIIENGRIVKILREGELPTEDQLDVIDVQGRYIAPGFIDVHVHGGGGIEVMDASPEDIVKVCSAHSKYGTTSILPTTLASSVPQLCATINSIKAAVKQSKDCNILGVHLEGPFLSLAQCGAQSPDCIYPANEENVRKLLDCWDGIRMMGAAPEIPNGYWLGEQLKKRNIIASIAHSDATFEETIKALEYGYEDITHIYSGCSVIHRKNAYRIAGVVEAGLYEDRFTTQVIADGKHLPASLLKLIYKCKGPDRIVLISDGIAMAATEVKEGERYLQKNGVSTIMDDGVMKLLDKQAFAGSIATMSKLVYNMVTMANVPIVEAVRMATYNPAKLIRVHEKKGTLAPGMDADIVVFDKKLEAAMTIANGTIVHNILKKGN